MLACWMSVDVGMRGGWVLACWMLVGVDMRILMVVDLMLMGVGVLHVGGC